MDHERKKKRQKISVLITEAAMVLAVITIVVVMTFVAMGYKFGQDGAIEQSGLMQLHTLPTGATVQLDDEVLFSRSNLSQTMAPGDHNLKITKNGYDSWEKTITMSPGRLMRLYYPRLFLQNREAEKLIELGKVAFYSAASNRNFLLYAEPESIDWKLINIKGDEIKTKSLDISDVFSGVKDGKLLSKVESIQWSDDESRVLVRANYDDDIEWVLVDLKDVDESVNLTKEFGLNFERMELANSSAGLILSLENGNIRKINVDDRSISRILVEKVADFDNHGADMVYVTSADSKSERKIGIYKDGSRNSVIVKTVDVSEPVWVGSSAYYDDEYLIYTIGSHLTIYSGKYPIYDAETMKNGKNIISLDSEDSTMRNVLDCELSLTPKVLTVSRGGEYILAYEGDRVSSIDLDTEIITDYATDNQRTQWLDDSMLYGVVDGKLLVWDFDGHNKRELLSENVSNKVVTISGNNKYLYYVTKDLSLVREKIQ